MIFVIGLVPLNLQRRGTPIFLVGVSLLMYRSPLKLHIMFSTALGIWMATQIQSLKKFGIGLVHIESSWLMMSYVCVVWLLIIYIVDYPKTIMHLLRDCDTMKELWEFVINLEEYIIFHVVGLQSWLHLNFFLKKVWEEQWYMLSFLWSCSLWYFEEPQ